MPANLDPIEPVRVAAEGLIYPSESDEPIEPFHWPVGTAGTARDAIAARSPKNAPIEEQPADEFFDALSETSDAQQFATLRRAIEDALHDLHVFRVGEVEIAIFVIGQLANGEWAGVQTVSVET